MCSDVPVPGRRRSFRIRTERLTVRILARDDITAFTHYRKLPGVARYQDWPMPYTRDLAHELVDEIERLGGPTPGEWVQLAIDDDDGMVGDVAVWLDVDDTLAMIGYTLDPLYQGRGYATEAVSGVIDWLFRRRHVHRIAATIDPRNLTSARVLERCGFEYIGTARSSAFVRGEWQDDARFSLLEPDWKAWRRRPTGPPATFSLVDITADNVREVGEIRRSFTQRQLVAPVSAVARRGARPADRSRRPRAAVVPGDHRGRRSGRLRHDGRTLRGQPAPVPVAARRRSGATRVEASGGVRSSRSPTSAVRADSTRSRSATSPMSSVRPARFYERLGFVPTGKVEDGETEAVLRLTP